MARRIKNHSFHVLVWRVFRPPVTAWVRRKFNFAPEVYRGEGPYLILCNHNTDWDPILLAAALPEQTYFVASEHIFRWGLIARLIRFLVDPIARLKGTTAGDTALTVVRRLKAGANVAIFAEGNRSFNGLTGPILPSTGKLARSCGASLITYRMEGGYFTSPRWCGKHLRRGRMTGKIMHVLSHDQLRAMTADQVNELIRADLFEDAYATQRRERVPFQGKRLAEGLERVLCLCPKCGGLDTMASHDDTLSCGCGFSVKYDTYGFIRGEDAPFDNITDWDAWQKEKLLERLPAEGPIFSDGDMVLAEVLPGHRDRPMGRGTMTLYPDRLECCGHVFGLAGLEGFALHGAQSVSLTCQGHDYEITSEKVRCTRKYMQAIDHLRTRGI